MDEAAYAAEAKIEATHWWFVERRRLFSQLIRQANIPADAAVVDIGTGTGANLRLLKEMGFSRVTGIDASPEAARWCAEKGLGEVKAGDIRALPLADNSVDLIMATDVVEHVDEDDAALREISRVLRPDGLALITVPAFPSLWGLQDIKSHHYRRYRMDPFLRLLERTGLKVEKRFHFNFLLFVPIFLARQVLRVGKIDLNSENEVNSPLLNRILRGVFRLDVTTAPYIRPPFGVSILVLARPSEKPIYADQN
ncbi:MAG: class I SAM-dependent methyltransferase [Alphaproteobacteria bacterium]|nr:class I SAM-dependent methyltransferase [Alphaproteobacteria bacterium]